MAFAKKKRKAEDAVIDFGLHAGIMREDPDLVKEIPDVLSEGVPSFKMFTVYEFGLGNGFINDIIERLADVGGVGMFHTEDGDVCDQLTEQLIEAGNGDIKFYPQSRPAYAEAMAAEDIVRMAVNAGMKYYGVHTTNEETAAIISSFEDEHELVRAETCVHYTVLDQSHYDTMGNLAIMAPPLRTPSDDESLFDYIDRGTISVVSTDHCAYHIEDKQTDDWWDSSFGVNSLQTHLPVFYDEAVNNRGYSPSVVVRLLCSNPADTFGLPQKGTLQPGTHADIVLFDPIDEYTITADDNQGNAEYSIYEGRTVRGKVKKTLVRGSVVAENGELIGDPGYGEFIHRERPRWSA